MKVDIEITPQELTNSAIDDIINLEKSLSANRTEETEDIKTPFYLNPVFYYSLSALICAIIGWGIGEPFINEGQDEAPEAADALIGLFTTYLVFASVAASVALGIAASYGASNRNVKQMFYCGVVSLGVGLVATILTTFVGGFLFGIMTSIAGGIAQGQPIPPPEEFPFKGFAFFVLMCGRGLAWAIVSIGAGLGLGIALKSKKHIFNGLIGGLMGGLLGGLLFDPICRITMAITKTPLEEAILSRAIGFACIGLMVGFFIGLIENMSKESWFLMQKGPLTGKQFILFRNLTLIGSSPKSDIYLFKDSAIDPKHATVTKSGNKYILKDENSDTGIFVNGRKVDKYVLQSGDVITIGETVLKYMEKK